MNASNRKLRPFFLNEEVERGFVFAQAMAVGDRLYVAGTLSVDDSYTPVGGGNMAHQLQTIYQRIRDTLSAHDGGLSDVVKETVYVTDMDAFLAANPVRAEVYGDHTPACTVVEVSRLAFPECMAEIELIAYLAR